MKKALLVVSFGTSHAETRKRTIEAIEQDLCSAFPERKFYRAWSSGFLRKKRKETEGVAVDSVTEAMERMRSDGIEDVLIQPTHMMAGAEFGKTEAEIHSWRGRFSQLRLGSPLLAERTDLIPLAAALEEVFSGLPRSELLALMGHGSGFIAENPYVLLQEVFSADGFDHFTVGTVEHAPGFAPVLNAARERRPERVTLAPLMVVAGDHALHDMSGPSEDSWESRLRREGFATVSILKGLGEYAPVRELYVAHARRAGSIA